MINNVPEGKSKATGCFAFPCSLCPWAVSGTAIVSVCGGKNKYYPPNTWCKRTPPATENTGLFFYHPFIQTFLVGIFWLWKCKTCHSSTLKRRNKTIILDCEDEKISYLKLQKSESISCFHVVSTSVIITARDQFLSGPKERCCAAKRACLREDLSQIICLSADFVWDFE